MRDPIHEYARRPFRYENIDGIGQLGMGLLFMGIAALGALQAAASEGSIWQSRGVFLIGLLAFFVIVMYGMWALKRRIKIPRTGYVKYRGIGGMPWPVALLALAIGPPIAILYNVLVRHSSVPLKVALVALACAEFAVVYAIATRMEAAWNWVVLVVMVVGPVAIYTLPIDRQWNRAPSIGFLGLTFFVSGAITLYLYLHRTRPPEEGAVE